MTLKGVFVAGVLWVGMTCAVANAGNSTREVKENATNRKIMHAYARCVVKMKRIQAGEAIISNSDNGTIMKRYSDLISSECMAQTGGSVQMRFGGDLYRYALADALVNSEFSAGGDSNFSNRLPLAHLLTGTQAELDAAVAKTKSKSKRAELEEDFKKRFGVAWLSRYGECVVRRDPVKARLWLLTPPDGPEETSRITDLMPAFNECLGEGTLKFNRVTMRGTVAINYYRLAKATPQPLAGKTQ